MKKKYVVVINQMDIPCKISLTYIWQEMIMAKRLEKSTIPTIEY